MHALRLDLQVGRRVLLDVREADHAELQERDGRELQRRCVRQHVRSLVVRTNHGRRFPANAEVSPAALKDIVVRVVCQDRDVDGWSVSLGHLAISQDCLHHIARGVKDFQSLRRSQDQRLVNHQVALVSQ